MIPMRVLLSAAFAVTLPVTSAEHTLHSFKKLHLDEFYWSEGANFGDLNRDGSPDAISGPYWWEAPAFTKRHELYPPATTFALKQADVLNATLCTFAPVLMVMMAIERIGPTLAAQASMVGL